LQALIPKKDVTSLFANEIVFCRPVKRQQQRGFSFGARLG
jgi:hypothetical protein